MLPRQKDESQPPLKHHSFRQTILRVVLPSQVQESDTLRSALCRRGADGVLGLHAAVAQLQATKFRLRSCEKKVLDHPDLPAATSGVLR